MIMSILMHHRDQRCNALQSVFGIFLHSCNTPEKLVKVLAHMGLTISLTSVHRALRSLSVQSEANIRQMASSLLTSHGYDNFDAESKALVPTVDGIKERLMHLTSGAILRLDHGVTREDLRCSQYLWDRSELNHLASDPQVFNAHATFSRLLELHPEPPIPSDGLSRRGRFRRWFFQLTLFKYGPAYFHQFQTTLHDPEPVDPIPVTKLEYMPYRAMDINQSKVSGNIEAIQNTSHKLGSVIRQDLDVRMSKTSRSMSHWCTAISERMKGFSLQSVRGSKRRTLTTACSRLSLSSGCSI